MKYTTDETLRNWFAYHQPSTPDIVRAHEFVRERYGALAKEMNALLPEGPDKTLALRAIRDASMQANAAIACAQELHPDAESAMASITYVSVVADADSVEALTAGIHAGLKAAFPDRTPEQVNVFLAAFEEKALAAVNAQEVAGGEAV